MMAGAPPETRHLVGVPHERIEDAALLRGEGQFIDDCPLKAGTAHAAFVRSPHAHARILSVNVDKALALPGVLGVLTGEDVRRWSAPFTVGVKVPMQHWCIAVDRVRFVGEPLAIVCADNRYIAEDAAALVSVEYERLNPVVDPEAAAGDGAPLLHPDCGSNVVSERTFRYGDPESAFVKADHVVEIGIRYPRNSVTPIETLGAVAEYSAGEGAYDILTHFQGPFALHPVMALALRVPGHKLRLRTPPDSGGSFGVKHSVFTYVVALALASRKCGRPVKWIEDRLEHLSAATSATNRITRARAAVTREGVITGLEYDQLEDCGAYLRAPEPATIYRMHGNLTGAYRIPNLFVRNRIVLTNKTPTGLVRGFGGPQVYFALERLTCEIARSLELDHIEVIRRNLVRTGEFPYRTASGGVLDSGDYPAAVRLAEELGVLADLKARREQARARGKRYGIGLAAVVEPSISNMGYITTVLTPEERERAGPKGGAVATATVSLDPLGSVSVHVASVPQGQGHRTVLAQVVAEAFGLELADIRVAIELDTARDAWSVASGNYSSRFAGAVAGSAHLAATRLKERLAVIAASQLGCEPADIRFAGGKVFSEKDRNRTMPFRRLAATSHWAQATLPQGMEPVIRETVFWSPDALKPPNSADEINSSAAHGFIFDLCGLEIDPVTGKVRIDRYVSIHDAGKILNPALADGQIRGSFSNAVGAALYEHFAYGPDGSFLSGTFAEYVVPTAAEVIEPEIFHLHTPSPVTPLGAKGLGEGNCMSTPVAIANAAADALGVQDIELPLTPARVHALLGEHEPARPERDTAQEELKLSSSAYGLSGAGSINVPASPQEVWNIVLDPAQLRAVIPGCKTMDEIAPGHFRGEVNAGIGVVRGLFKVEVLLSELDAPWSLRLRGKASGALGESQGEAVVKLEPVNGGTRVTYAYGADISGTIASVGGRMVEGAARVLIGEFFRRLAQRAAPENAGAKPFARFFGLLRRLFGGRA
jgi:2-furoyl-CoA dehydrogenase large subunit